MKQIILTLNDEEAAQMGGWVNYYKDHPEFVGKIPTEGVHPPDGQTRLVLGDQSRERYEQLAAQFVDQPPLPFPLLLLEPKLVPNASPIIFPRALGPGEAFAIQAEGGPAEASFSVDGSFPIIGGVYFQPVDPSSLPLSQQVGGTGGSGTIVIQHGQWFTMRLAPGVTMPQTGRVSSAAYHE